MSFNTGRHFQPQLGVITRTVSRAASEMIHFFILFFLIIVLYTSLSHILFGGMIAEFSTFGSTMETMVNVLLGSVDVGVISGELGGAAGTVFFYTYVVAGYLILLNMLLAILIEAYLDVKGEAAAAQPCLRCAGLYRRGVPHPFPEPPVTSRHRTAGCQAGRRAA